VEFPIQVEFFGVPLTGETETQGEEHNIDVFYTGIENKSPSA
jgi:hypothetical protein